MQTDIRGNYGVTLNESGGCYYGIGELWKYTDLEYRTLPFFITQQLNNLNLAYNSFEYSNQNQTNKDSFQRIIYNISGDISGRLTRVEAILQYCISYLKMHNYNIADNMPQYSTVNTSEYYHSRHNFKKRNKLDICMIDDVYSANREDRNFCAHEILPCISMLDNLNDILGKMGILHSMIGRIYYHYVNEFERKQYEYQFFQAMYNDTRNVIINNQPINHQVLRPLINKC